MWKLLAAFAVWYFILYSQQTILQVGPFATEAACTSFAKSLDAQFSVPTSACFSTTAKQ
jgi:hypothetical protein